MFMKLVMGCGRLCMFLSVAQIPDDQPELTLLRSDRVGSQHVGDGDFAPATTSRTC